MGETDSWKKLSWKSRVSFPLTVSEKWAASQWKLLFITTLGWLEKRNEEEATFLQGDKLWDSFMIDPLL
jgi:hypothetical protein